MHSPVQLVCQLALIPSSSVTRRDEYSFAFVMRQADTGARYNHRNDIAPSSKVKRLALYCIGQSLTAALQATLLTSMTVARPKLGSRRLCIPTWSWARSARCNGILLDVAHAVADR